MDWIAVVWSGLVATTFAMTFFWLARSLAWTSFSPAVQIGCLFIPHPRRPLTETIGVVLILLLGSSVVPALYAALLRAGLGEGWLGGALIGAVHGVAGVAALPVLGTISACVRSGTIAHPGPMGIHWGRFTPAVVLAGHLLYGILFGASFGAFRHTREEVMSIVIPF